MLEIERREEARMTSARAYRPDSPTLRCPLGSGIVRVPVVVMSKKSVMVNRPTITV